MFIPIIMYIPEDQYWKHNKVLYCHWTRTSRTWWSAHCQPYAFNPRKYAIYDKKAPIICIFCAGRVKDLTK